MLELCTNFTMLIELLIKFAIDIHIYNSQLISLQEGRRKKSVSFSNNKTN